MRAAFGLLLTAKCALAQLAPASPPIAGDAVDYPYLAAAVAMSDRGDTLLAGAPQEAGYAGGAWLFVRTASGWVQAGAKLVGSGAVGSASQGYAVAISVDGGTLVIGGPFDDTERGAVWVFVRSGGGWVQQGPKLTGTGLTMTAGKGSHLGYSVAVSADGNTIVAGAPRDNNYLGAVCVFERSAGVWSQTSVPLADASGPANQGSSVALARDGRTMLSSGGGSTLAYTRVGSTWSEQGVLPGSGVVALSHDGSVAIMGQLGLGGAVFERSAGVWTQQGPALIGTGSVGDAAQGWSVALSADGSTALVGGVNDDNVRGAGWLFVRRGGRWLQSQPKLVGPGSGTQSRIGWSAALSADGQTAALGGPGQGGGQGAAWVFERSSMTLRAIRDVPGDQGGRVRLTFLHSALDSLPLGASQVTSYAVWRRIPAGTAARTLPRATATPEDTLGSSYDLITTLPAIQAGVYNVVVPTLADSSSLGPARSTFLVTAHTADPDLFYVGAADSGSSVDNLAPPAPQTFTAAVVGGEIHLDWSASAAPDVGGYRLYRGSGAGFIPNAHSLVGTFTDTQGVDPTPSGGYYKLSAVDVHGNESAFAALGPVLDVHPGATGLEFALRSVRPNPSLGGPLHVSFVLPQQGDVRLELFDANGRRCSSWEQGALDAGPHDADLEVGAQFAAGVYVLRLTQAARSRTTRVTLVR